LLCEAVIANSLRRPDTKSDPVFVQRRFTRALKCGAGTRRVVSDDVPAHPTGEQSPTDTDLVAFSDLARAAYCPRQCYYARADDDRGVPSEVAATMELAHRYPALRDGADLGAEPIAVSPTTYRDRLDALTDRPEWPALANPLERDLYLAGKDCHGIAHKLLSGTAVERSAAGEGPVGDGSAAGSASDADDDRQSTPPIPVIVSPGAPHETGVWEPQSVRAVAAAKALAWEREREIPRALVEYPAHAVVRSVRLGVRRTAAYRRALRTARGIDGPPPRLRDSPRCEPCAYREECGVETKSLRSRLGL
jgi:CRISPR-associated exonuclease Cas4